ncbi:MAG: NAD-dependent epimerase/dehydratase family protein [Bacteroidia bacterium]
MDKVLILGGTNFIGRNLVEALLAIDCYDLTLFNRGVTNPELFPNIKKIIGNRNTSDLDLVLQNNWDYIIDLSCYFPDALSYIGQINTTLKRYIFISTCSVYDNEENKSVLRNESSPILSCNESQRIDTSVTTYGNRKAECERIVQKSGLTFTIFRPALVYGRYDTSDRFYYWLYNIQKENSLLIPNGGVNLFSVTYVDDLV